jgi:RNA polymerase sigma-70 factor (ECF subfamily)
LEQPPPPAIFATTHWTVVLSARDAASPECASSLEALCRAYWYPLYAYVRRRGHRPHDAQDLTQEFFACLLRKQYLNAADREKGRFRTFLIVALQRFLANDWDRTRAQKRGGGQGLLSLDAQAAEQRYLAEPAAELTPDRVYERRWALTLLERTMARLRHEFTGAGKAADFDQLKRFLTAEGQAPAYSELARQLNSSEGAARVAVHRVRKRFREVFREEISQTVAGPENVEEEIRHLLAAMAE